MYYNIFGGCYNVDPRASLSRARGDFSVPGARSRSLKLGMIGQLNKWFVNGNLALLHGFVKHLVESYLPLAGEGQCWHMAITSPIVV